MILMRCAALVMLFTLPATASIATELRGVDVRGQPFSLASQHGNVSVLIMTSRHTRGPAEPVIRALGPVAADGRAKVACVVDLMDVPRIFHGYAQNKIREGTRTSPIRYLAVNDDSWRKALAAAPERRVDIFVFDRQGLLRGHFDGCTQLEAAMGLIETIAR
jgi:hypothetical protein